MNLTFRYCLGICLVFQLFLPKRLPLYGENLVQDGTQIVAEVNSRKISKVELEKALKNYLGSEAGNFSDDERHLLLKGLLIRIVERELLLQVARKKRLQVHEEELKSWQLKLEGDGVLEKKLLASGLTRAEFLTGVKDDLTINKYLEEIIYHGISVSKDQLAAFFSANSERFRTPIEYKLRTVVLLLPHEASLAEKNEITSKLSEIRSEALQGTDFVILARKYTQGPNGSGGGELGYVTENQISEELRGAVAKLAVGEVSEVITASTGVYLLKLEGRRGGELPKLEAVEQQISGELQEEARRQAYSQHIERLKLENRVLIYLR